MTVSATGPLGQARDKFAGVLLIALSATAFGAMAIFARFAYAAGADVYGLLAVRFVVAALAMAVVMRTRGIALPPWRRVLALAAMGGIGYVGQSYCFFTALNHAQASLVALLLYLYPLFVTLLAAVFLKEKLTTTSVIALVLCSVGAGLTVGGGEGAPLGIALGVAAAVIYSIYIVVGARVTAGVNAIATTTVICSAAALVYVTIGVIRTSVGVPPQFPSSAGGWLALLAIALVSTVLAIMTFFAGLQKLGAAKASMLSTLEPVVTVVLAAALLGEHIGVTQAVGGALILLGVLWLTRRASGTPQVDSDEG
ncbi:MULTISPECIES: DMT family transporter [unclassified Cupriavidus]|uniref:DMT family transporter n=1 Tax=unclassified Cupriavidus TaxID=2640874 RepID=UPI0010F6BB83|nr:MULTISPECIES: DMT family transporter [unclassified Cupriavidus]MWL86763.1 EamA family transporter [Cupriavidus sp. SW-Y-13]